MWNILLCGTFYDVDHFMMWNIRPVEHLTCRTFYTINIIIFIFIMIMPYLHFFICVIMSSAPAEL